MFISKLRKVFVLLISVVFIIFGSVPVGNINGTNVLAANAGAEIESPQLISDTLYVTIYRRNQAQNDGKYSIFSVPLSHFLCLCWKNR